MDYTSIDFSEVAPKTTVKGTYYFDCPGIKLISYPINLIHTINGFLDGFDPSLDFDNYLNEYTTVLPDCDELVKFAGQLCYLSLGPKRTMNDQAARYFQHIKESGHGSVFEHANFSFLLWGISRTFTHELVRHRAGFAFSQVSQRYVDGKALRFVKRPEFDINTLLSSRFEDIIDSAVYEYDVAATRLLEAMSQQLEALPATDRRKAVNQAARAVLPNCTEAPIVVTANARAWRHFLEMRCAKPAEPEARIVAYGIWKALNGASEFMFNDYTANFDERGYPFLETKTRKV